MGGDAELLSTMVDYFVEDSPLLLLQLKTLIDAGDAAEASRIAHSLKGLCANFEAEAATEACASVERPVVPENWMKR
jgi:HPt (histidine-containing phosphotransfer) domain-containing protein